MPVAPVSDDSSQRRSVRLIHLKLESLTLVSLAEPFCQTTGALNDLKSKASGNRQNQCTRGFVMLWVRTNVIWCLMEGRNRMMVLQHQSNVCVCVCLTGRVFDPNKHCGVQDPETKRSCTRSLTCKVTPTTLRKTSLCSFCGQFLAVLWLLSSSWVKLPDLERSLICLS